MSSLDCTIYPIFLSKVKINDEFWVPRISINHEITIPHVFRRCEETGRISKGFCSELNQN